MSYAQNAARAGWRNRRQSQSSAMWDRIHEQDMIGRRNNERVSQAIAALRLADPQGWEAWYDSDAVPEFSLLDTEAVNRVLDIINARVIGLVAHE